MSDELKIDKRGHALWLTIDRPAQRNAMNSAVLQGIRAGLEQAHKDPEVRAVVLTGAGDKAFCAGADLAKGSGSFQFDEDPDAPMPEMPEVGTVAAGEWPLVPSTDWGRLGVTQHMDTLAPDFRAASGERILVIGTSEYVWRPFLLAERLEKQGAQLVAPSYIKRAVEWIRA